MVLAERGIVSRGMLQDIGRGKMKSKTAPPPDSLTALSRNEIACHNPRQ
jgi:hypothetical protein